MPVLDTGPSARAARLAGAGRHRLLATLSLGATILVHDGARAQGEELRDATSGLAVESAALAGATDDRPNIILMVSDDYGWPYYGFMIDRLRSTLRGRDQRACDVNRAPCSAACRDDFFPGQMPAALCAQPFDPTRELDVVTPSLDELAAGGIAFERGYVADSACTPAYRALLSGLNLRDLELADGKPGCAQGGPQTIPEALGRAGYNTMLAGKSWLDDATSLFNGNVCNATTCRAQDPTIQPTESPTIGEDVPLELLKRFIKAQDARAKTPAEGRRPWFVMWSPLSPHYSYNKIPAHIRGRFDRVEVTNPPHITSNNFGDTSFRAYLEAITYYDERVGELVDFLDLLEGGTCDPDPRHDASRALDGLATPARCTGKPGDRQRYDGFRRNTLIIYLTDNPAGVQQSKAHFSENGLRTPLIVNYPNRIGPTGRHEALVGAIDVFPTLLDYARRPGEPLRAFPDAMSLRGIAEDPSTYPAAWRRYLFSNATSDGFLSVIGSVRATYADQGPKSARIKVYSAKGVEPTYGALKRVSDVDNDSFESLLPAKSVPLVSPLNRCLVRYGADAGAALQGKATVQHLRGVLRAWSECRPDCRRWLVQAKLTDQACGRVTTSAPPAGCAAEATLCKDPEPNELAFPAIACP